jgi:hypothetical protein
VHNMGERDEKILNAERAKQLSIKVYFGGKNK